MSGAIPVLGSACTPASLLTMDSFWLDGVRKECPQPHTAGSTYFESYVRQEADGFPWRVEMKVSIVRSDS
jgi:hypothetical protein